MKKWQRTLLISFIWGAIFIWWYIRNLLISNWDFDLFSLNATDDTVGWLFIIDEFRKGWVIKDAGTVTFFIILILTLPIYILGLRYFLKVEWLKLIRRCIRGTIDTLVGKESSRPASMKDFQLTKKSSKTTRPRALDGSVRPSSKESELKVPVEEPVLPNAQGQKGNAARGGNAYGGMSGSGGNPYGAGGAYDGGNPYGGNPYSGSSPYSGMSGTYTPPSDSPFSKGFNLPSMEQGFSMGGSGWNSSSSARGSDAFEDVLLSDIQIPERTRVVENIIELFEKAGYKVLANVMIGRQLVEYVAVSETRVVVAVEDTQTGDWLADEERFNGEDPLWFSESSHRISPIFQMLDIVKSFMVRLSENGFSGTVLPMFIERDGVIINAEDMQTTWKDLSVVVCRTGLGGPDELKTVAQAIIAGESPSDEVMNKVRMSL